MYLVAAAKDGDHQAYAELCRRHSKQILRTVLGITRDVADAEDTLQEALLTAYIHIGGFEGRSAFSSWLTRISIRRVEVPHGDTGFRHACSQRIPALATSTRCTRIFSDRVAQRYESEFTERHPQSVLKLPRQRRTDTSFAEHRAFLSDCDPGSTGVPRNGSDVRPLYRRHGL
jgi:Sigma-70 region 2